MGLNKAFKQLIKLAAQMQKVQKKTIEKLKALKESKKIVLLVKDYNNKEFEVILSLYMDPKAKNYKGAFTNEKEKGSHSVVAQNSPIVYNNGESVGVEVRDVYLKHTFLPKIPLKNYLEYKTDLTKGYVDLKQLYDPVSYKNLMNIKNPISPNQTPLNWETAKITTWEYRRAEKKALKEENKLSNYNLKFAM